MKLPKVAYLTGFVCALTLSGAAQDSQNQNPKTDQQRNQDRNRNSQDASDLVGRTTTATVIQSQPFLAIRASEMFGKEVQNEQGKEVGNINDLLLDIPQGRVAAIAVGSGGVLGIGEKNHVVPPQAIQYRPSPGEIAKSNERAQERANERARQQANDRSAVADQDQEDVEKVFVLNMDEKLKTSTVKEDNLTSYSNLNQVYSDYQQTPYWQTSGEPQNRQSVRDQDQPGRTTRMAGFHMSSAKKLLGQEIKNNDEKDIGEIQDFIIDVQSGRILYATVSAGGLLGIGDNVVAIPPRQFQVSHEGHLMLSATEERLKNAPKFNKAQWGNLDDPTWVSQVYAYYGETVYWKPNQGDLEQRVRDRDDSRLNRNNQNSDQPRRQNQDDQDDRE